MGTTCNITLRVAAAGAFRPGTDYDRCLVSVKLLDANGDPTGSNLVLDGSMATAPEMTQWHPGYFVYTTAGLAFTRGSQYRATYTAYLGGTAQDTQTQDFYAHSEATAASAAPTLHTYTTLGLRNIVRRSLGIQEETDDIEGQEPGSANSLDMVNDACERVWREHRWQFTLGEPVYGPLVAGQSRYPLPDDFMELVGVTRPDDQSHVFTPATLQQIRSMRERGTHNPIHRTFYAVVSDPPADLTGHTRYALEIFPTPEGFLQSGYVLDYQREYPKLVNDTDAPPFPAGFHSILKQACRMEAFEQENVEVKDAEIQKFERMLDTAKKHDGRHLPTNLGSLIDASPSTDAFDNTDLDHDSSYEIPSED
jgi:hypothetical protein